VAPAVWVQPVLVAPVRQAVPRVPPSRAVMLVPALPVVQRAPGLPRAEAVVRALLTAASWCRTRQRG